LGRVGTQRLWAKNTLPKASQLYLAGAFIVTLGAFVPSVKAADAPAPDRSAKPSLQSAKSKQSAASTIAPTLVNALPAKKDDGKPTVRLIGVKTDVAKRYRWIVPPFPVPPFTRWRQWFRDNEESTHCALEWRDKDGQWWHGELRSTHFDVNAEQYRVGYGEFPGTSYDAYGIYIIPGRVNRGVDKWGRPIEVVLDEAVNCDYEALALQIRRYGAKGARPGDPGTGGKGECNVGLGGPAYKPAQNSNTMVSYVLRQCGITRAAPNRATGWDVVPKFPYSSDADAPPIDSRP
jgi:hypothetical protein